MQPVGFRLTHLYYFDALIRLLTVPWQYHLNSPAKEYFAKYGVIILFISSFTPLPYKVFVITAGFLSINLLLFIIISFIGRGLRFYLVSYVSDRYGAYMIDYINRYFLYIAAFTLIFFVLLI